MNMITIHTSESGTRSENVDHSEAESHIAANGAYATESQVLLAFIESEGVPTLIKDYDGDLWELSHEFVIDDNESVYSYDLVAR